MPPRFRLRQRLLNLPRLLRREQSQPPPKIFELVAGEGDNYAATAAPDRTLTPTVKMPAAFAWLTIS